MLRGILSSALSGNSLCGPYGRCVPELSVAKLVAVVMGKKSVSLIFISQLGISRN